MPCFMRNLKLFLSGSTNSRLSLQLYNYFLVFHLLRDHPVTNHLFSKTSCILSLRSRILTKLYRAKILLDGFTQDRIQSREVNFNILKFNSKVIFKIWIFIELFAFSFKLELVKQFLVKSGKHITWRRSLTLFEKLHNF